MVAAESRRRGKDCADRRKGAVAANKMSRGAWFRLAWGAAELLIGGCLIAAAVEIGAAARWIFGALLALCGTARCGLALLFRVMRAVYPQIRVTQENLFSAAASFDGGVYDIAKAALLFAGNAGAARLIMVLSGVAMLTVGLLTGLRSGRSGVRPERVTVSSVCCRGLTGAAVLAAAALGRGYGFAQMLGILFEAGGLTMLLYSACRALSGKKATIYL